MNESWLVQPLSPLGGIPKTDFHLMNMIKNSELR